MHSPEDVAWAESCLSEDPNMIDAGWDSIKDALFEVLCPSPYEREDSPEAVDMDIAQSGNNDIDNVEEKIIDQIAGFGELGVELGDCALNSPKYVSLESLSTQFQSSLHDMNIMPLLNPPKLEEILSSEGRDVMNNSSKTSASIASTSLNGSEDAEAFWSKHKKEDVFLPAYVEILKDLAVPLDVDFVFQEPKSEQSTEDIFKIWDLDTALEENDLMKQVNKALAGNPLEPAPPLYDDSESWKGLNNSSVDDLIAGIAELTLSKNSDKN